MKTDAFRQFLELLRRLQEARISYVLKQVRDEAIMVAVDVPGERWEIEFVDYGDEVQIEVERFTSSGQIENESALGDLFVRFSDSQGQVPARTSAPSRA
jgi:hypothetical protein